MAKNSFPIPNKKSPKGTSGNRKAFSGQKKNLSVKHAKVGGGLLFLGR